MVFSGKWISAAGNGVDAEDLAVLVWISGLEPIVSVDLPRLLSSITALVDDDLLVEVALVVLWGSAVAIW